MMYWKYGNYLVTIHTEGMHMRRLKGFDSLNLHFSWLFVTVQSPYEVLPSFWCSRCQSDLAHPVTTFRGHYVFLLCLAQGSPGPQSASQL